MLFNEPENQVMLAGCGHTIGHIHPNLLFTNLHCSPTLNHIRHKRLLWCSCLVEDFWHSTQHTTPHTARPGAPEWNCGLSVYRYI